MQEPHDFTNCGDSTLAHEKSSIINYRCRSKGNVASQVELSAAEVQA